MHARKTSFDDDRIILSSWFVVPFAFSSLGCLAAGADEVVMRRALAARYAASEAAGGVDEAAGRGILHARWLPRLSAAVERGAWGRLRALLRVVAGAQGGDGGLAVSELLCVPHYLSVAALLMML